MVTGAEGSHWTAVVGALIAVYAATLSTWQAIRYFREERPRIKVRLYLGQLLNTGDDEVKLFVTFVNVGKIPVTIPGAPALKLNTQPGSQFVLNSTAHPIPQRLETFADNTGWVDLKNLSQYVDWAGLEKGAEHWITGLVRDASGKTHESVPYVLFHPKRREKSINLSTTDAAKE